MIKIGLIILQFTLIKSLNFKNFISSLVFSSQLLNPLPLLNPYVPSKIINSHSQSVSSTTVIDNNIYFYGEITAESCKELNSLLIELDKNSKMFSDKFKTIAPPINLHIQSEGGSLMNTFYVVDLINNLETPVYTFVDGYAASAGSLISVTGKKRYMTKNSFILIHQLSSSMNDGKFNDLDDNMNNLNKFMNTIRKIYLEKTKIPIDNLNNILEHDLWLNSQESLDYGLVDYII